MKKSPAGWSTSAPAFPRMFLIRALVALSAMDATPCIIFSVNGETLPPSRMTPKMRPSIVAAA